MTRQKKDQTSVCQLFQLLPHVCRLDGGYRLSLLCSLQLGYLHPTPYIVQQRTDSICILYDSSVVKLRENCFRVFVNIDRLDKIGRTTFSTVVNSENLSPTIFRHSSMVDIQRRFEDPLLCSMQPLARHHLKTLSRFVVLLLYIQYE